MTDTFNEAPLPSDQLPDRYYKINDDGENQTYINPVGIMLIRCRKSEPLSTVYLMRDGTEVSGMRIIDDSGYIIDVPQIPAT